MKFYEIIQIPNTYRFERKELLNKHVAEFKYLSEIPDRITGIGNVAFKMTKLEYKWSYKKGIVETFFEKEVSAEAIRWLTELIKNHLFKDADRVFLGHRLKGEPEESIYWSNSECIFGVYDVKINDFRILN